jgi:hypothetical protein
MANLWGIDDSIWKPFEDAYWNSQPPAVQSLRTITLGTARETAAKALALEGYIIDVPIMVWGQVAYIVMLERQQFGYTWVPSGLQPNLPTTPGNALPGLPPYDPNNPPPGSINVSINIADYPPYVTPAPAPPAPVLPLVGALIFDNIYAYGPGVWSTGPGPKVYTVVNGQMVTQDGATYKAVFVQTLMGSSLHFEKQ